MVQLHRDFAEFGRRDTVIAAIGPEDASAFSVFWKRHSLPFYGLPDGRHQVLKLYGQKVNLFKLGRMPAQMIIDKGGVLRYVHYGHAMHDIPKNKDVLALIDNMQG